MPTLPTPLWLYNEEFTFNSQNITLNAITRRIADLLSMGVLRLEDISRFDLPKGMDDGKAQAANRTVHVTPEQFYQIGTANDSVKPNSSFTIMGVTIKITQDHELVKKEFVRSRAEKVADEGLYPEQTVLIENTSNLTKQVHVVDTNDLVRAFLVRPGQDKPNYLIDTSEPMLPRPWRSTQWLRLPGDDSTLSLSKIFTRMTEFKAQRINVDLFLCTQKEFDEVRSLMEGKTGIVNPLDHEDICIEEHADRLTYAGVTFAVETRFAYPLAEIVPYKEKT